jgi:hypothetical protein
MICECRIRRQGITRTMSTEDPSAEVRVILGATTISSASLMENPNTAVYCWLGFD